MTTWRAATDAHRPSASDTGSGDPRLPPLTEPASPARQTAGPDRRPRAPRSGPPAALRRKATMIRRMLACLPLLAVAPDRSHGVAWQLPALLIPLVRALARRSGGPGVRMALPGAALADGVVDTRSDALVRHGPVSQMWRRASGYRNVGILCRPAVGPGGPVEHAPRQRHPTQAPDSAAARDPSSHHLGRHQHARDPAPAADLFHKLAATTSSPAESCRRSPLHPRRLIAAL